MESDTLETIPTTWYAGHGPKGYTSKAPEVFPATYYVGQDALLHPTEHGGICEPIDWFSETSKRYGLFWLNTDEGKEWLKTEGGKNWLKTKDGSFWLKTNDGKKWLTTNDKY